MTETEALAKMVPPGQPREGKWRNGVIQVWTTRACDKSCFACTQGSNLKGKYGYITPEQFEQACISLKDYWGVVGMFGGNPAMHPEFDILCEIMRKHIPFEQRGLWCNNLLGKGQAARETFNPRVSNLNVHLDRRAYDEFKATWPESMPFGLDKDSRHSPVYVSMSDLIPEESIRWRLISNCDINQHWSAMIGVFRNELRGYFCEIAGGMSMLHQGNPSYPDVGVPVEQGWWQRPMEDFKEQVRLCCHNCAVPLRGYGELAQAEEGTELTSPYHMGVFLAKRLTRRVEIATKLEDVRPNTLEKVTHYLQNSSI